ncbi:hypothetical protein HAX54_000584 [Datura stramonium]|uniref:Uncharacterized protein n=1 Tax=Datura stramonium TaxID=4076 RepID=A0ABS8WU26_DATST|nr:hypothetical protein [Datura stramonium]
MILRGQEEPKSKMRMLGYHKTIEAFWARYHEAKKRNSDTLSMDEFRHTLGSSPNAIVYHVSFPYAHVSREADLIENYLCFRLVPEARTHVTAGESMFVYALMKRDINIGAIIKDVLRRERVKGKDLVFGVS